MKYLLNKKNIIILGFLFLLAASSTARAADIQWFGYWNFRKGEGKSIIDLSPAQRNGVINDAAWVMGRKNKALYFDGDGDYVDVKIPFHVKFRNTFYFDIWLRLAETVGSYHVVSCLDGPDKGFALTLLDGKIYFWLPGGSFRNIEGTKRLGGIGWHHISAGYANGNVKLFLDGELIGQGKRTGDVLIESSILRIGAMNQVARLANYNGVIDELYISDTPYVLGAKRLKHKAKKTRAHKLKEKKQKVKAAKIKKKVTLEKTKVQTEKPRKKKVPKFVYQPQEKKVEEGIGGEKMPPQLIEVIPVNNAANIQSMQNIHMIFSDVESGVDPESVVFVLNGIRRPVEKFFDYLGRLHVKFVPRYGFRPDALIEYNISLTDLSPRKNRLEQKFQFYTVRDMEAPYLENADSSETSKYMLSFYIRDNGWGVLKPSVFLKINGVAVEGLVSGSKKRAFVTYKLSKPLLPNEDILVEVLATDTSPRRNRLSKTFYWGSKGSISPFAFGNKTQKREALRAKHGVVTLKTYKEEDAGNGVVRTFAMKPGLVGKRLKVLKKKKVLPKKIVKKTVEKKKALPKKIPKEVVEKKKTLPKKIPKEVVKKKKDVSKQSSNSDVVMNVEDSVIAPRKLHTDNKKPEKKSWFSTSWFSTKKVDKQRKKPKTDKIENLKKIIAPKGMVFVAGGEFLMGSWQYKDEMPERIVYISSFFMDKYPVTQHEYIQYVNKTSVAKPKGIRDVNLPVVNINWEEAAAYAKWKGRRLPTEAEWEKAARGTDRRIWPWGNSYERINVGKPRGGKLTPVDKFPRSVSPYGCYDMAGNAWEWVSDWYSKSYYNDGEDINPKGSSSGRVKVMRGGSFYNQFSIARSSYRSFLSVKSRKADLGFRTVLSLK